MKSPTPNGNSKSCKLIREHSEFYDLRFVVWPDGSNLIEFEGFVKVSGGIKRLVNQYNGFVDSADAINDTHKSGFFSPRPYRLGQSCDGSITACVLALFYRFCQKHKQFPDSLLAAAYPKQKLQMRWPEILASADWQGVACPTQWNATEVAGLLVSLHQINYHSLAGVISDLNL
jgi:hypothetical protein